MGVDWSRRNRAPSGCPSTSRNSENSRAHCEALSHLAASSKARLVASRVTGSTISTFGHRSAFLTIPGEAASSRCVAARSPERNAPGVFADGPVSAGFDRTQIMHNRERHLGTFPTVPAPHQKCLKSGLNSSDILPTRQRIMASPLK